jgi:hypothetical protein
MRSPPLKNQSAQNHCSGGIASAFSGSPVHWDHRTPRQPLNAQSGRKKGNPAEIILNPLPALVPNLEVTARSQPGRHEQKRGLCGAYAHDYGR